MHSRGPDASSIWDGPGVLLGHTRLRILDLSDNSDQPISSPDGQRVLVYNGEVYNHRGLGDPPLASDTLALSHFSQLHQSPERLRGMFAYAVWHRETGQLALVRDRFGMKPLYLAACEDRSAFASYAKDVARLFGERSLNLPALRSFLRWGSVQGPMTMYESVREVGVGHQELLSDTNSWTAQTYWTPPVAPRRTSKSDVAQAIKDSLAAHLLADVPMALFLSAGIDSTLLAALAAEAGSDVHALTIGLPGSRLDEATEARATAHALGLPHETIDMAHDEVDFEDFFEKMDQPSIDGLNTYLVAQAANRAGFRVALSGLGSDEIFGGYPLFRRIPLLAVANRALPRSARSAIASRMGNPAKAEEAAAAGNDFRRLHEVMRSVWSDDFLGDLPVGLPGEPLEPHPTQKMSRITILEVSTYLRNTLLRDADVHGMAHSVEIRTPFVDHVVLEAALGYSAAGRFFFSKGVLRQMLRGKGVDHVLSRRKTGFDLPFAQWLIGPLRTRVKALDDGVLHAAVGPETASRLLTEAHRSQLNQPMKLWSLVVLDAWLRREGF